jgi:chromosome segregation ATPase
LNYGKVFTGQQRLSEAINSFKEVIVLGQSHNTAIEIVRQAALELSEAQTSIAAELRREKQSTEEEKEILAAELRREKQAAEEEKKILAAELRAEKDSLTAEQSRLRQKTAQVQVLNQKLQSLSQDKETLATTLNQIQNAFEQLVQDKENLATTLNRIYDSHG